MKQYGKSHGEFDLITGSFLDPAVLPSSVLNQADILFVNNVAFSAQTNQQVLAAAVRLRANRLVVRTVTREIFSFKRGSKDHLYALIRNTGIQQHSSQRSPADGWWSAGRGSRSSRKLKQRFQRSHQVQVPLRLWPDRCCALMVLQC